MTRRTGDAFRFFLRDDTLPPRACDRREMRQRELNFWREGLEMRRRTIAGVIGLAMLAACGQPPAPQPETPVDHGGPLPPRTETPVDHGGAVPPPGDSRAEEGYRIAIFTCSECHVVAADQKVPPRQIPRGPTFVSLADNPDLTPERLREHLMFTHRTPATPSHMPNPQLFDYEMTDVIATSRASSRAVRRQNGVRRRGR
jgi:hypothetical protein